MSKQEQIEELKKALEDARLTLGTWRRTALALQQADADRKAGERKAAEAKKEADRVAAENATIRQIEDGLIPVAELRHAWHATQQDAHDGTAIEFRFSPTSGSRIQSTILKALMEPAKPRFATGGYIPVGVVHRGEHYFPNVVELSPADRKLLSDIADGVSVTIS